MRPFIIRRSARQPRVKTKTWYAVADLDIRAVYTCPKCGKIDRVSLDRFHEGGAPSCWPCNVSMNFVNMQVRR